MSTPKHSFVLLDGLLAELPARLDASGPEAAARVAKVLCSELEDLTVAHEAELGKVRALAETLERELTDSQRLALLASLIADLAAQQEQLVRDFAEQVETLAVRAQRHAAQQGEVAHG